MTEPAFDLNSNATDVLTVKMVPTKEIVRQETKDVVLVNSSAWPANALQKAVNVIVMLIAVMEAMKMIAVSWK